MSKLRRQMYFSLPVEIFFLIILTIFAISCVFPLIFVAIISFTDNDALTVNG